VFARLLRQQLDHGALVEIRAADLWVDEALEHLEREEPSLRAWLEKDYSLNRALKANMTAIYQSVVSDAGRGQPFERSLDRVNQLIFRIVAAAAWRAALNERSFSIQDVLGK
jgi:hypothetical protein